MLLDIKIFFKYYVVRNTTIFLVLHNKEIKKSK